MTTPPAPKPRPVASRNGRHRAVGPAAADVLARVPPHNLDAERSLLGCVFLKPEILPEVTKTIGPADFHADAHQVLYQRFLRMAADGVPIDIVTTHHALTAAGELEKVGGSAFLGELAQSVGAPSNWAYHAGIVAEHARRRRLILCCTQALADGYDVRTPAVKALETLRADIDEETRVGQSPQGFRRLLTSAELAAADAPARFLVENVVVEGQPGVLGGRSKSLKTSVAVDLAISLGSGTPFLGKFEAVKATVGFWSGESGKATIRETALRVANTRGVELNDCAVHWSFDLPHLTRAGDLHDLERLIAEHGLRVAIVDPLYMALLEPERANQAGNLYAMGSALGVLTELGQRAGCTVVVLHHFRKSGTADESDPAGLEELTMSGVAEWARWWVLLQRRSPYRHDGHHDLWMRTGGSVGHAGLWAMSVDEGVFLPGQARRWDLDLEPVSDAQERAKKDRENRRADEMGRRETEYVDKLVCALRKHPKGQTGRRLRADARLNNDAFLRAVTVLEQTGRIEMVPVPTQRGSYEGFRLKD